MKRSIGLAIALMALVSAPALAGGLSGQYIEARTCDIWTGPCFANAEVNLGGKHAILGWKVDRGSVAGVPLDGLSVVAVIEATDTLGVKQTGPSKAVVLVDRRASAEQRDALVRLAREQGGKLVRKVVAVQATDIELDTCGCETGGCGLLRAGEARIRTRCLDEKHDKVCGNESAFYPPLTRSVKVQPAIAVESSYSGKGIDETWDDAGRRGAYLGSFQVP